MVANKTRSWVPVIIVLCLTALLVQACSSIEGGTKKRGYNDRGRPRISILASAGTLAADPALAGVQVRLPQPYINGNWAQSGGNIAHNPQHLSLGAGLTLQWTANVGRKDQDYERVVSPPVVAKGVIYSVDSLGVVYATRLEDGAPMWRKRLDEDITEQSNVAFGGGVSYSNGMVFVTSGYGFIAALDASSGAEKWRYNVQTPMRGIPTVVGNRVITVTSDNLVLGLDRDTGDFVWDHIAIAESAGILGAASPASDGTAVVAALSSGELVTLLATTGQLVWQDSLSSNRRLTPLSTLTDIDGDPIVADGRAYAVGHAGRMVSIDMRTGERSWEADVASVETPWLAGGFLFVSTIDAQIACLQASDGRVRWVRQMQRFKQQEKRRGLITWSGPVLAGDRLITASSQGFLATLSPYTGDILSVIELPAPVTVAPIVVDETLLVLTTDQEILAFR